MGLPSNSGWYNDASPKLLENRLASDPVFFSEVISIVYRSKDELKTDTEPTESQRSIAENAYRLQMNGKHHLDSSAMEVF